MRLNRREGSRPPSGPAEKEMQKATVILTIILAAVAGIGARCVFTDTTPTLSDMDHASVGRIYTELLKTIDVPQDAAKYGDLYQELGYQNRSSYGGYEGLPSGYWVYVKPSWYIWKRKAGDTGRLLDYWKGSVNCKYKTILKTFLASADRETYGELYDWGFRTSTTYGRNRKLPTGYWVYSYPNWYIWKAKSGKTESLLDYAKASLDGKYETILKTFLVPSDSDRYGVFHDWGFRTSVTYGMERDLPTGYWVYAYPYWYIWKTKTGETEGSLDCAKASVNGKYRNLLKTFSVPRDRDGYGQFFESGYADYKAHAGYTDLPPGYWVYVSPNWYIWEDVKGLPGPEPVPTVGPTAEEKRDPKSAFGKYYNLKRKISSPIDFVRFGRYHDRGDPADGESGSIQDLAPRYWVYVFPTWYIWEKQRETDRSRVVGFR
jgi:hypothetical protein